MVATPHDGSGTTVSFGGTSYTVTDITVNRTDVGGDDSIDVSHLGLTDGDNVASQSRPLVGSTTDTGVEVQIELLGSSIPTVGAYDTLTISGGLSLSACSLCTAATQRATVNDVIRSSATFRYNVDSSNCV